MNLIQWKPFNTMFPWSHRVNRFFDDDFLSNWFDLEKADSSWCPSTDIYESKKEYVFKVELPGIKKEDIKIEVKDDILTIKGERKEEKEVKKDDYHKIESYSGSFSRSFHIPKGIDEKKIKAELKDGILELKVPKSEEKKVKQVPISVN
jgi:HSP20 family protein